MQPCSREMQATNSVVFNQDHLQPDHDQISSSSHLHHPPPPLHLFQSSSHFDSSSSDDFLDHFLSNLPPSSSSSSWQDLKSPWGDLNHSSSDSSLIIINKLGLGDLSDETPPPSSNLDALAFPEESPGLPAKLRHHQITSSSSPAARAAMMILQQQQFMSGAAGLPPMPQSLSAADLERSDNDIVDGPSSFKTPILGGSTQAQSFGAQQGSVSGGAPAQSKPKVRARRGQATDPHSIAERLRRERIAERMKSLQELVPNANKTDKASMLDEIIDYVKFLQLQVKVLSMSRLGGAASVAPLVADISDGGGDRVETNGQGGAKSKQQTMLPNESLTMTEQQVAQLMEKDMGSAMQYLQGKGLCLMPISLATAISTSTGHSRNPLINHLLSANGDAPASPSMSVLTVQSTTLCANDASAKDVASVSKP